MKNNLLNRQITFGYIAEVAGLTRGNLKGNRFIRTYLEVIIESKESWYKRRITSIYHDLPPESKQLSVREICRMASIGLKTYNKYRDFFEEVIAELKIKETIT